MPLALSLSLGMISTAYSSHRAALQSLRWGKEKRFIKIIAEGDHLVDGSIIRNREFSGLRETGAVFGVGVDDPVIDEIDVAFAFFDEG
jgi:hypothetical protein